MSWHLDDPDAVMENLPLRRKQLMLAMCAMHLFAGNSIFCKSLKSATIKMCIHAIASFVALFDGTHQWDIRKDNPTDQAIGQLLKKVFAEIDRCEKVPERREPFSPEMCNEAKSRAAAAASADPDGIDVVLGDWFEIGLMSGDRKCEWAQENSRSDIRYPDLNLFGDPTAFCLLDIRIETIFRHRHVGADILIPPLHHIRKMWVKFRTQKNGHHGEERMFTLNPRDEGRDLVKPMRRVVARFVALHGAKDITTPLAIYRSKKHGDIRFVVANDIEESMRSIASALYKLDPIKDKKALQRWSAHSLRVGACVLLHGMGFTTTQIQWLLRWASDAFKVYLRNMTILADAQHRALDKAAAMPHFC